MEIAIVVVVTVMLLVLSLQRLLDNDRLHQQRQQCSSGLHDWGLVCRRCGVVPGEKAPPSQLDYGGPP